MKGILEKWTRDDIPNKGLREMSDLIGVNEVKALIFKCAGLTVHFPKGFHKQSDMNYITKHQFDDPEAIAEKLGVGVRTIYRKLKLIKQPF